MPFHVFQTNERKKTNAKKEKYLQNAERQANERRKKKSVLGKLPHLR